MCHVKIRFAAVAAIVALVGAALFTGCAKKAEEAAEVTTYTCPMHPEVTADKPGECPICGMDLVPAEELEPATGEQAEPGGS